MHALSRPNPTTYIGPLDGAIQQFQMILHFSPTPIALVEASGYADFVTDSGPPDSVVPLVVFGDIPSKAHVHIIVVSITNDLHFNAKCEFIEEIYRPSFAIRGFVWIIFVPPGRWWIDGKLAQCGLV